METLMSSRKIKNHSIRFLLVVEAFAKCRFFFPVHKKIENTRLESIMSFSSSLNIFTEYLKLSLTL